MKRIIAILLVALMVISLTACKSKEQQAADDFLKKFEEKVDAAIAAFEDKDWAEMSKIGAEIEAMDDEFEEILEDLKKVDEDAAKKFKEDAQAIGEKFDNVG